MKKLSSIFATICLAISYLAAGFGVCAGIPQVTQFLAERTSNYELSPYSQEALVALACETRDFTVENYGRSSDGVAAWEALSEKIVEAAKICASYSDSADEWTDAEAVLDASNAKSAYETVISLSDVSDKYALDYEAFSHLDDVNAVVGGAVWPLVIIAILGAAALAHVFYHFGKRAGAVVLLASGAIMLCAIVVVGAWALISFDTMFAALHSLFFAKGTWVFDYDSLLICMYPTEFWVGMAVFWGASTAALCAISIIIGAILRRKDLVRHP